jgi:hypothetical protein
MSGYGDMYKDEQQAKWLARWVPETKRKDLHDCPSGFIEQYRFTLARAREAEEQIREYRAMLRHFKNLMGAR